MQSLAVLGWNLSVSNLRWSEDYLLVDVDASPAEKDKPHAKAEDFRFGVYGALSHPLESNALGSCDDAITKVHDIPSPLSRIVISLRSAAIVIWTSEAMASQALLKSSFNARE